MGVNVYKNGYIKDDPVKMNLMLNDPDPQALLQLTGEEMITVCIALYEGSTKNDPEDLSKDYPRSFSLKETSHDLIRAIRVNNSDYTAEWVEFGAHAGGKTRILGYRVMGRAADVLESRGGIEA